MSTRINWLRLCHSKDNSMQSGNCKTDACSMDILQQCRRLQHILKNVIRSLIGRTSQKRHILHCRSVDAGNIWNQHLFHSTVKQENYNSNNNRSRQTWSGASTVAGPMTLQATLEALVGNTVLSFLHYPLSICQPSPCKATPFSATLWLVLLGSHVQPDKVFAGWDAFVRIFRGSWSAKQRSTASVGVKVGK